MSMSKNLTKSIENVIDKYIQQISEKYNVDKNELKSLWTGEPSRQSTPKSGTKSGTEPVVPNKEMDDLTPGRLYSATSAELKALCKYHNKKCS